MRKSTASTARQQNLSVFGEMLQWVKDGMPNEKGDKVAFLADGAMVVADNQNNVKDIIPASASTKKQLEGEATQQQTYLIYRLSGEDVRPLKLSKAQADSLIKELKDKAKAKSAKPKADVKASPAKSSVKAKSPAKAKTTTKKTSKKSGNAELLRSTATAVRAASKSIGKAAGELNTALDNLEALLKA